MTNYFAEGPGKTLVWTHYIVFFTLFSFHPNEKTPFHVFKFKFSISRNITVRLGLVRID